MIGDYYGAKGYAFLASTVMVITTIVGAGSPVFGGYVYDVVQSYSIPFYTCVGASAIGGICALLAKPPKRRAPSI
jgi:cyanate permease